MQAAEAELGLAAGLQPCPSQVRRVVGGSAVGRQPRSPSARLDDQAFEGQVDPAHRRPLATPRRPNAPPPTQEGDGYDGERISIDDDPDLNSPAPGSSGSAGKRKIQEAFDMESQEASRRVAGKAAVKRALAGALAAQAADPLAVLEREPSGQLPGSGHEPGAGWRVRTSASCLLGGAPACGLLEGFKSNRGRASGAS